MSSKTLYRSQSEQTFTLTPVDIYKLANREDDIGIFGYRPAKKYFDYNEVKWFQKRADILKKHKANWPPDDWPTDKESGAKKQPQRKNFIDDVIEWSKSCYDSKRAEEIKENLASKGHPIPEPGHDKPKQKLETEKRKKYLEREKELEAKRKQMEEIPEWKVNAIDQVKEKIRQMEENKSQPRPLKPNFTKCDRITVLAEAVFVGESVPFYNTVDPEKNKGKVAPEFFPDKKPLLRRYPSWMIGPKVRKDGKQDEENTYIKARNEMLMEKATRALEKSGLDPKTYSPDMLQSYEKVTKKGFLPFLIHKPFEYDKTEQYISAKQNHPKFSPGPGNYWDDGQAQFKKEKNVDDGEKKRYIMTSDKTYKRVYVPNMRKSIY